MKRKTEQDVQKQQSWKKVCEDLGIENPNAIVQGLIQIKPKVMVLIDSEYNVFTPGTDKTDPELVINSASGQKLYLKHVVGQNEKPIIRVENRMIQVSGNFLKSIGTYPVKIFDEETNSIVDHTVKFDVPPTNDV